MNYQHPLTKLSIRLEWILEKGLRENLILTKINYRNNTLPNIIIIGIAKVQYNTIEYTSTTSSRKTATIVYQYLISPS